VAGPWGERPHGGGHGATGAPGLTGAGRLPGPAPAAARVGAPGAEHDFGPGGSTP